MLARSAHQREGEPFPSPLSPLSLDLPSNASRNLMAKGGYSPCSGCALRVAPFPLRAFAMRTLAAFLRGQAKRLRREGNEESPQIHPQRRCEGGYRGKRGFYVVRVPRSLEGRSEGLKTHLKGLSSAPLPRPHSVTMFCNCAFRRFERVT